MAERLLMIEDDSSLAAMVAEYLGAANMEVALQASGSAGLELLRRETFDAVVLDIMLPDMDGFEVCRRIRAESNIPILMLTARGDEMDRIVGLELGADDYLPKPFNPRELLARLRAILRRRGGDNDVHLPVLRFGRLEVDRAARLVRLGNELCNLTGHQFDLLVALAENAGRVLSRGYLMNRLKDEPLQAYDRSIDVHVSRIRLAIEDDPKKARRIITVRGAGYVFARDQDND